MKKVLIALLLAITVFSLVSCSQEKGAYSIFVKKDGRSFSAELRYGNTAKSEYPLAYYFVRSDGYQTEPRFMNSKSVINVPAEYDYVVVEAYSASKAGSPVLAKREFSLAAETGYSLTIAQEANNLLDSTFKVILKSGEKEVTGNYKLHYRFRTVNDDVTAWRCIPVYNEKNENGKIYINSLLDRILTNDTTRKTSVEIYAELKDGTMIGSKEEFYEFGLMYSRLHVEVDPVDNSFVPSLSTFCLDNTTPLEGKDNENVAILYMVNLPTISLFNDYDSMGEFIYEFDSKDAIAQALFNGSIGVYYPGKTTEKVYLNALDTDVLTRQFNMNIKMNPSIVTTIAIPLDGDGSVALLDSLNFEKITENIKKAYFNLIGSGSDLKDAIASGDTEAIKTAFESAIIPSLGADLLTSLLIPNESLDGLLIKPADYDTILASLSDLKKEYEETENKQALEEQIADLEEQLEIIEAAFDNEVAKLLTAVNYYGIDVQIFDVAPAEYPKYSFEKTTFDADGFVKPVLTYQSYEGVTPKTVTFGNNGKDINVFFALDSKNFMSKNEYGSVSDISEVAYQKAYEKLNSLVGHSVYAMLYDLYRIEDVNEYGSGPFIGDYGSASDMAEFYTAYIDEWLACGNYEFNECPLTILPLAWGEKILTEASDKYVLMFATEGLRGSFDEKVIACELIKLTDLSSFYDATIQKALNEATIVKSAQWYWSQGALKNQSVTPLTKTDNLSMATDKTNRFLYYPTWDLVSKTDTAVVEKSAFKKNKAINLENPVEGYFIELPQYSGYTTRMILDPINVDSEGIPATYLDFVYSNFYTMLSENAEEEGLTNIDIGFLHQNYNSNSYVVIADDYYCFGTKTDLRWEKYFEDIPIYESMFGETSSSFSDDVFTVVEKYLIQVLDTDNNIVAQRPITIVFNNLPVKVSEFESFGDYESPNIQDLINNNIRPKQV